MLCFSVRCERFVGHKIERLKMFKFISFVSLDFLIYFLLPFRHTSQYVFARDIWY